MGKIEEEIIQYRDQHYTPFETKLEIGKYNYPNGTPFY